MKRTRKLVGLRVWMGTTPPIFSSGVMYYPPLDVVQIDSHGFWDAANNRVVIPAGMSGRYRLTGGTRFGTNGTGYRYSAFEKNGPSYVYFNQQKPCNSYPTMMNLLGDYFLAQGETLKLAMYQTSGSVMQAEPGADSTWLGLELLGDAN